MGFSVRAKLIKYVWSNINLKNYCSAGKGAQRVAYFAQGRDQKRSLLIQEVSEKMHSSSLPPDQKINNFNIENKDQTWVPER